MVFLGLLLAFFVWILPASQGSSLPQDYFEFAAAMKSPALYRIAITFDVAGWFMLGGFFVALAAIFVRRAPVRGAFIAARGVGQVVGMTEAFLRLEGASALAARYAAASPDQREALLRPYQELQQVFSAGFSAEALLWGIALLLAASVAYSVSGFPRWLVALIALPGIIEVPKSIVQIVTGADLGFLIVAEIPLLVISFFAVSWAFRHPAPVVGGDAIAD